MKELISGIYKIQSLIKPDRIYIGSAIDINDRWRCHIKGLKRNKHHSAKLQNHFNKYGLYDLEFSILLECDKANLIKNEQIFIDKYNPYFNICKIAGSCLGVKHSEETKKKMSILATNRVFSEETRKKMSDARKLVVITDETCKKISISLMGKKHTEEAKQKMRDSHPDVSGKNNPMYGLKGEDNPNTGRVKSIEEREKLSKAHKGIPQSLEHRLKTVESWKKREVCKCIYCGLETNNKTNITRWHNDKCKFKPII